MVDSAKWATEELNILIQRGVSHIRGMHGTEALLRRIASADSLRRRCDELLHEEVIAARREGLSWAEIADALDMTSRQAAQQRFSRGPARRR